MAISSTEQYVIVTDDENEQPIELPAETDGTLLLSTLAAQFTGACGLKYHNAATNSMRGVRLCDGRLHPPDGVWGSRLYVTVFPKTADNKRKADNPVGNAPAAKSMCLDPQRKCSDLIVLGIPFKSTEDDMQSYFGQYGELVLCQVKRDPHTNHSKGYGFIRFADFEAQIRCLTQRHFIEGRWCDVRIPNSKEGSAVVPSRKVFVGRCTEDMTTDDLRSFFSQYGEVLDVFIPRPFRAFAFVTFSDPNVAQRLCGEDFLIKGASVHVGTAAPKATGTGTSSRNSWSSQRPGLGAPTSNMMGGYNSSVNGSMASRAGFTGMLGTFSDAVITAAQSALAQQGWGTFLEAMNQSSDGIDKKTGYNTNAPSHWQ